MSELVTWLVGRPGWTANRARIDAPDRDAAALLHIRAQYSHPGLTVEHVGQGWYDWTHPEFYGQEPYTAHRAFRVARAPSQARRGVDEGAAREALVALHGPGWAVREPYIVGPQGWPGRADLLVLPDGESSVGYEIKTDRDTLVRLPQQVPMYDHCCARRVLATTPRHVGAARRVIPAAWGLVLLDPETHAVTEQVRAAQPQASDLASRLLLANDLWSEELNALLADVGVVKVKRLTNERRVALLAEHHGVDALRVLALKTLAARTGTRVTAWRCGEGRSGVETCKP